MILGNLSKPFWIARESRVVVLDPGIVERGAQFALGESGLVAPGGLSNIDATPIPASARIPTYSSSERFS